VLAFKKGAHSRHCLLAEKAFKKLSVIRKVSYTLFPFYQILSDGGGDRGKFFRLNGERTKTKQKLS